MGTHGQRKRGRGRSEAANSGPLSASECGTRGSRASQLPGVECSPLSCDPTLSLDGPPLSSKRVASLCIYAECRFLLKQNFRLTSRVTRDTLLGDIGTHRAPTTLAGSTCTFW